MAETVSDWWLHSLILLQHFIVKALYQGTEVCHVFFLTPAIRPASLGNDLKLVKNSECVGKYK